MDRLVAFDGWVIARVIQPVLDEFELEPVAVARWLLSGAVVARLIASSLYLHVLGTLVWLTLLGVAYRDAPRLRVLARTPSGLLYRLWLLVVLLMFVPFMDASLLGDDAYFAMLSAAVLAFYVLAGTSGRKRRVEVRRLRFA